jgi:hypothetical protein
MRYEMTGAQRIRLSDGRWIKPGDQPFEAELERVEHERFVKAGCIRPDPVASQPESEKPQEALPRRRGRFIEPRPEPEEAQED